MAISSISRSHPEIDVYSDKEELGAKLVKCRLLSAPNEEPHFPWDFWLQITESLAMILELDLVTSVLQSRM